jgi:hypothetical protein
MALVRRLAEGLLVAIVFALFAYFLHRYFLMGLLSGALACAALVSILFRVERRQESPHFVPPRHFNELRKTLSTLEESVKGFRDCDYGDGLGHPL